MCARKSIFSKLYLLILTYLCWRPILIYFITPRHAPLAHTFGYEGENKKGKEEKKILSHSS